MHKAKTKNIEISLLIDFLLTINNNIVNLNQYLDGINNELTYKI